ncbi:MAG: hypothetical protein EA384_12900 [Spirochaetaceae bacterium]|nr:MAG: hypothetical protein EA384_12900 [Spirochaetaceae bacterium]
MRIAVRRVFPKSLAPHPQRAAALLVVAGAVVGLAVWKVRGVEPPGALPLTLIAGTAAVAVVAGCAVALCVAGFLARRIPRGIWYASGVGVLGVGVVLALQGTFIAIALLIGVIIAPVHALLGAGLGAVMRALGSRNDPGGRAAVRRAMQMAFALAAIGMYGAWLFWFLYPGSDGHLAAPPAPQASPDRAIYAADSTAALWTSLAEPGPYGVRRSSYGSGQDQRRAEYGAEADIVAEPVDLSALLPAVSGFEGRFRRSYWGFDATQAPIGGVVWAPEAAAGGGSGAYPLVLIVHGNHPMHHRAELGYDYLAQQLASHGYIAVSVDQNYLNFSWLGEGYGRQEIPARAWLLLEHLRVWQDWNADPASPWYGRVDLSRIALVGHSRGGEAVAVAALFNELSAHPDKPGIEFDFGFDIRGVVALAPSDGFYRPGGGPVELSGIDYVVLHGGHDGDVPLFMGLAQYERVSVSANSFKALAYIYRGSHAGFSSIPRSSDMSFPFGQLLNNAPLIGVSGQHALTTLYVTAFVEASLRNREEARTVFRSASAALQLLPKEWVLQRYRDGRHSVIADFDADRDPRVTADGRTAFHAVGLERWDTQPVTLRAFGRETGNRARVLSWPDRPDSPAAYFTVTVAAETAARFSSRGELLFSLADVRVPPPGERLSAAAVDLVLLGHDDSVVTVELALLQPSPPPLVVQYTKLGPLERALIRPVETVLRSYRVPLDLVAAAGLPPHSIRQIRFAFDIDQPGSVILDEIGYAAPH